MTLILDGTNGITNTDGSKLPADSGRSIVRVNTANGYGSTSTRVRRFTNVITNQGADITYADSATLGASFTINTSGIYSISYSDNFNNSEALGITLNESSGSTILRSLAPAEVLANSSSAGANFEANVAVTAFLAAGTIIRAHTNVGATNGTSAAAQFIITRIV